MKKQINLYQPSCYPKREKVTFRHFLVVLGLCAFGVITLILVLNNQLANTFANVQEHKALITQKTATLSDLAVQLKKHSAPQSKITQEINLQAEITARQRLLKRLSGVELAETVSFSDLMRGFSLANMDAISIAQFSSVDGRLNISGEAKYSDSVALWLSKAHATQELANISFEKLSMTQVEGAKTFSFKLTNSVKNANVEGQIK